MTLFNHVMAQNAAITLPYTQYTVADGLAQMQVRSIYADRDGLVWIGTQGGLSYYDGNVLNTIQDAGPLSEEYIVTVYKGSENLYISSQTAIYAYNGTKITRIIPHRLLPSATYATLEDPLHYVWLLNSDHETKLLNAANEIVPLQDVYPTLQHIDFHNAWGSPEWGKCYILDRQNRFYVFYPESDSLTVDSTTFQPTDQLQFDSNLSFDPSSIIFHKYEPVFPTGKHTVELYAIEGDQLKLVAKRFATNEPMSAVSPRAPISFIEGFDQANTVYVLQDSIYVSEAIPYFSYSRFKVEAHHKVYLATDEGLIVINGEGIENISFPDCDYPWSVVPDEQDNIYIGCYKTGVFKVSPKGQLLNHFQLPYSFPTPLPGNQILSNYLVTPEARLWGSNSGFMALRNGQSQLELIPCASSVEAMATDPADGSIIIGSRRLLWFDPNLQHRIDSMDLPEDIGDGRNVNDLLVTEDRILWVAAPVGIVRIDLKDKSVQNFWLPDETLPCKGAVTMDTDAKGNLWVGSTCGLLKWVPDQHTFISVLPDLIKGRINQISMLPEHRLACSSNNDLYILDIAGDEPQLITMYNESNGLRLHEPSENGSSLYQNKYMWLPAVQGIQRLDIEKIIPGFFPAAIRVVKHNGKDINFLRPVTDTVFTLENVSLLDISLIDHSARKWLFRFSMNKGSFSPWQSAKQLLVSGLQHGYNDVRIQGSWAIADPGALVETGITLETNLPFLRRTGVQRMMVILLVLAGFITIIGLFKLQRGRQLEKKLQDDLQRNRLKTIQAYLNPHFLFNTLTSIQDRILQQDAKTGNDIILRLSRVFRKVLDTGKVGSAHIPMIRLSEEISLIEDMVWLNNQQLANPIKFMLDVDPATPDQDPLIPPLLIEPFVENAFKHAFGNQLKDQWVHVKIAIHKSTLTAEVLDNGVGYDGSGNDMEQATLGMPLAKERMDILNQLGIQNNISFSKTEPQGTHVIIQISLVS